MEKLYEELKKDTRLFLTNLDTEKIINYSKNFGKLIGLEKHNNTIHVSPQYVVISHMLYPSYTGRIILLASTAAVMVSKD